MKAAFIEKTGGPEVIQYNDLPRPNPQRGEVLVRVKAAAVNPIDTYIRSGLVSMNLPMPYIPGCDLAGVVEDVGQDANRFQLTNRV
jgi:NADPH2:quinone reductase